MSKLSRKLDRQYNKNKQGDKRYFPGTLTPQKNVGMLSRKERRLEAKRQGTEFKPVLNK